MQRSTKLDEFPEKILQLFQKLNGLSKLNRYI